MSETCGGCVYDGRPLDGVEVGVGERGRVRLRGPVLYDGNDGDPALTGSLGPQPSGLSFLPLLVAVVAAGGVAMLLAFLVFGKRRRGEPAVDDAALAASAAAGFGYVPTPDPAPVAVVDPAMAAAAAAVASADAGPAPDRDGHLPRWRRPSLMEARKADPTRGAVAASARLTFAGTAGEAIDGLERRRIRYRMVSLLNQPDEVRGVEIGSLDAGDEVVLMEKHGTFWRVLCPDGRQGWLHKMTLGDVVIDSNADSWTSAADDGPSGGFEDVLRAYTESRRQFGEA
jgi:hypothetical protein